MGEDVSKAKAALGLTWGKEEAIGAPGAIRWLDSYAVVGSGLSTLSLVLHPCPATDRGLTAGGREWGANVDIMEVLLCLALSFTLGGCFA